MERSVLRAIARGATAVAGLVSALFPWSSFPLSWFLVEYLPDDLFPVGRDKRQGCFTLPVLYVGLTSSLYQEQADLLLSLQAHGIRDRRGHVQRRVVHVVGLIHDVRSSLAQQHLLSAGKALSVIRVKTKAEAERRRRVGRDRIGTEAWLAICVTSDN